MTMIDIRICKSTVSLRVQVESKGHAGVATAGNDPVCAAVSSLLYGYAKEIERISERDLEGRSVSYGEANGYAMIDVACKNERCYRRVMNSLGPVEWSLQKLCQTNPEAVKVSYINED